MSEIDFRALQKEAQDVVLPDGDYVVIITSATPTTSSNGKPMIKLQFTIVEGPKKDRKVFTQWVLSPENPFALQMWFRNHAAVGLDQNYFNANPSLERIAQDLMNRGAIITLTQREWQGSMRNEVQGIKPYAPNGPLPPGMVVGPPSAGPTVPVATASSPAGPPVPSSPPVPPTSTASSTPTAGPAAQPTTAPPARPF